MNIIDVRLKFKSLTYGNKPSKIILHNADASSCTIQDIHQWHLQNGWSGCGYHYFIKKDGSVYKGRPDGAIGAHCQGSNNGTLGICFEGKYMTETMPAAQYTAGIELIKFLRSKYGNLPIMGHKELFATSCPGDKFPLSDFKNLKANDKRYVVTNYLKPTLKDYDGICITDVLTKYFQGIKCYVRYNTKGMWIETQYLTLNQCNSLKNKLGNLFYSMEV